MLCSLNYQQGLKLLQHIKVVLSKREGKNLTMFLSQTHNYTSKDILLVSYLDIFFREYCFPFEEYQAIFQNYVQYQWELGEKRGKYSNFLTFPGMVQFWLTWSINEDYS